MGLLLPRRIAPGIAAIVGTLIIAGPAGGVAGVPEPPAVPVVAPPPVSLPEVPPAVPPPVSLPAVPQAPAPAPSIPQLESPTQLESVPEPQSAPLSEVAQPGSATASRSPSTPPSVPDTGGPSPAPNGSASPGSSSADPASLGASAEPGRAGLGDRLDADRKLRATVDALSGCLYAVPVFERGVLRLRTGFGGKKGLSRGQVARRLNASRDGVRRAERRGVRGLRQAARTDGCGKSATSGGPGLPEGLVISLLATGGGAIAGEPLAASNDLDGRQRADGKADGDAVAGGQGSGRGALGEDGPSPSIPSSPVEDRDNGPWLLIVLALALSALALLGSLGTRRRERPSVASVVARRPQRRRPTKLSCAFCRSKRIATNPAHGVYRCVDCGFSGALSPTPHAEAGKMHDVSKRS